MPINLDKIDPKILEKYSKEKIEEAIKYLSYAGAPELPKEESEIQPVMYIFRHGQSTDNADFIFSGWRDSEITNVGVEQAKEIAPKIKDKKIHMLISSPQKRAVDTMKYAISLNEYGKKLEIHTDERIKERSYGDLQGKSKLEIQLEDPEKLLLIRRSYDYQIPNGESLKMVCERVFKFCSQIIPYMKSEKINIAVSCHGNSIRGFRRFFENLSDEETAAIETPLGKDYASYVIKD